MDLLQQQPEGTTLRKFLTAVKSTIMSNPLLQQQWVIAEISDFRVNRHCYMQLLEKDSNGNTTATARATIWQNKFIEIAYKFENATGQRLGNGMKVMLCVSVSMSEQYGLSLNVTDISPEYTLGDMLRIRREIIKRLTQDGIIDMNKSVGIPIKPQRIAVISAAGAAGYGDFCKQLHNNPYGIKFYTCLFAAIMQGQQTVPTVIYALERINQHSDLFDIVVIIRGGGSTTDLNSFDDYDLATHVANCPLPVITGIGHERDTTVLDYVAAIPVKTPTAAAEWLISQCSQCLQNVLDYKTLIANTVTTMLREERKHIEYISNVIPISAKNIVERERMRMTRLLAIIPATASGRITTAKAHVGNFATLLRSASQQFIRHESLRLDSLTDKITLLSPQNILNRGYSITTLNGHAITEASQVNPGDILVTQFKTGKATSIVNKSGN